MVEDGCPKTNMILSWTKKDSKVAKVSKWKVAKVTKSKVKPIWSMPAFWQLSLPPPLPRRTYVDDSDLSAFDQSDEQTWPDQQKDKDNAHDKDKDKDDWRNSWGTLRQKFYLIDIWHLIFDISFLSFYILHFTFKPMDQWTNGPMDQLTNWPMDQWTNGPMDQWTNEPMD